MRKYNLSKIMQRAWTLVKEDKMTISSGLKKAWTEAKRTTYTVTMCVIGRETFTVDKVSGKVIGKTYHSKEFLKDNFNATWDAETSQWTVDVEKFTSELDKYKDFYKKYIVSEDVKTVKSQKLVNRWDGYYCHMRYTDGTSGYAFIG